MGVDCEKAVSGYGAELSHEWREKDAASEAVSTIMPRAHLPVCSCHRRVVAQRHSVDTLLNAQARLVQALAL
jgi:hypothetical protein